MNPENDPSDEHGFVRRDSMLERFFYMILLMLMFAIAETMMWVLAIGQFLWMLFNPHPNDHIAEFGARLDVWLKRVALYLSATTDEKPFPWREID